MKIHTKLFLIGGYMMTTGICMTVIDYLAVHAAGFMLVGVGLATIIRAVEMLIRGE